MLFRQQGEGRGRSRGSTSKEIRRKLEMEQQEKAKERPVDREAKEQRSSEWAEFQEWFAQRRQESLQHREPDEDKT